MPRGWSLEGTSGRGVAAENPSPQRYHFSGAVGFGSSSRSACASQNLGRGRAEDGTLVARVFAQLNLPPPPSLHCGCPGEFCHAGIPEFASPGKP